MSSAEQEVHSLTHLASYLAAAADTRRLYRLLIADPAWMESKFAAFGSDASYQQDLETALRRFADPLSPAQAAIAAQLFAGRHLVRSRVGS